MPTMMRMGASRWFSHGGGQGTKAHLVGIAGSGMQALAAILLQRGWRLTGSDLAPGPARWLEQHGVCVYEGHSAQNVAPDTQVLAYSPAVPVDNAERRAARAQGIPELSLPEMLAYLTQGQRVLAVAGTHGKSTTTAMLARILCQAGADPMVYAGAAPGNEPTCGRAGRGSTAVVEACEYRRGFLVLAPRAAAILNLEPDHFDCYPTAADLEAAFARFAARLPQSGLLLVPEADAHARRAAAQTAARVETFGLETHADWCAHDLRQRLGCFRFRLSRGERLLGQVALSVPGRHNVSNALAAAALAWESGVRARDIVAGLESFCGLKRRLQHQMLPSGVVWVDDYAHHPTAVRAALAAVRAMFPQRRLICVFQPHQASRLARMLDEFAHSLQNADLLAVVEVARVREGPPRSDEPTARDLARRAAELGAAVLPAHAAQEVAATVAAGCTPGDVVAALAATEMGWLRDELVERLRVHRAAG